MTSQGLSYRPQSPTLLLPCGAECTEEGGYVPIMRHAVRRLGRPLFVLMHSLLTSGQTGLGPCHRALLLSSCFGGARGPQAWSRPRFLGQHGAHEEKQKPQEDVNKDCEKE
ncbi:hypothetical protein E2562_034359 [Oryza meyeriana var. granulata]|uniref:Uncharacterized protein n=1 Tax=Oryza meyeriana var. granulata TaxID=110450 RepID=A0A6G1FF83_9ORYZ|nr:hypothetical protein E2562_034359 [Oryza meyeriana var. granulata]